MIANIVLYDRLAKSWPKIRNRIDRFEMPESEPANESTS